MSTRARVLLIALLPLCAHIPGDAGRKVASAEIESFNRKFQELHLKMDNAGVLALWEEDGVALMPGQPPLVWKPAITAWLNKVTAGTAGSKVTAEDLQFHDIIVSGDWASEWATEHQVVEQSGKPAFEGYGKLALVLHRSPNGEWKIKQEMWNSAPRP